MGHRSFFNHMQNKKRMHSYILCIILLLCIASCPEEGVHKMSTYSFCNERQQQNRQDVPIELFFVVHRLQGQVLRTSNTERRAEVKKIILLRVMKKYSKYLLECDNHQILLNIEQQPMKSQEHSHHSFSSVAMTPYHIPP